MIIFQYKLNGQDTKPVDGIRLEKLIELLLLTLSLPVLAAGQTNAPSKPNLIWIMADDLGWGDLGCYGQKVITTPNLDRMAAEGMRFTHCFANPLCSPSRGQLITGRYPFLNGLKVVLANKNQEDMYLRPSQPSFPRQLKEHGYATQIVGKWHLSLEHKHDTIRQFGFDHYQTWSIFDDRGQKTTRYWNPHQIRDGRIIAAECAHVAIHRLYQRQGRSAYLHAERIQQAALGVEHHLRRQVFVFQSRNPSGQTTGHCLYRHA